MITTTFATAVTRLRRRLRHEPAQLATIAWQVRLHAARRAVPVFGSRQALAA